MLNARHMILKLTRFFLLTLFACLQLLLCNGRTAMRYEGALFHPATSDANSSKGETLSGKREAGNAEHSDSENRAVSARIGTFVAPGIYPDENGIVYVNQDVDGGGGSGSSWS